MIQITFLSEGRTVSVPDGSCLLDVMRRERILIDAPCAGRGTCGKCLVSIDGKAPQLACQTIPDADITVETGLSRAGDPPASGFSHPKEDAANSPEAPRLSVREECLAAFDLGTTTVAGFLLRASDGQTLAISSCDNPQAVYGADVISRISEALAHGCKPLTACIREAVDSLLSEMTSRAGVSPDSVKRLVIAGNTCMHHLFLGITPSSLGHAPYLPAVTDAVTVSAASLGLHAHPDAEVYLPPNIAGYVGGDTVACMTAERLSLEDGWTLLLDIGTNGEIVLGCKKRLIACSAAAGPAFEGSGISCGMRSKEGAICHASWQDGRWETETIGHAPPAGICGSGLLDAASALLESGQMDETGLLADGHSIVLAGKDTGAGTAKIELTQKDIRQLQLAKGAIRAAIGLLCEEAGIHPDSIQKVLLAGAFGSRLSPKSACRIGLIPPVLLHRIHAVGNAAGRGARLLALSERERQYAEEIATRTEYLELAALPGFQDAFVSALNFTEEEDDALIR